MNTLERRDLLTGTWSMVTDIYADGTPPNSTATGIAGFSNIQVFKGSSHTDTLSDASGTHTWTLTGPGAGSVDGDYTFSSFENLIGAGSDTLKGPNTANTFVVTGANAGSYNTSTLPVPGRDLATSQLECRHREDRC